MPSICLHFHVHQSQWLRRYTFFDINHEHLYEDRERNLRNLNRLSEKCYLPANKIILNTVKKYKGDFRVAFSITGIILDQLEKHRADVLDGFKRLADTGCVEFTNETYYHSLASLFSLREFKEQVVLHKNRIKALFGQTPRSFRHTGLVCNNDLARTVEKMGYTVILAEEMRKIPGWQSPNYVYQPPGCRKLKLLFRNYRLSHDIASCFSDAKPSSESPLPADKHTSRIRNMNDKGDVINLFMDYGTLGEHGHEERGIPEFIRLLPREILKRRDFIFQTPAEIASNHDPIAQLDVGNFIAYPDAARDANAWRENALQKDALTALFGMEAKVRRRKDELILHIWRMLQESDHFYCMRTKDMHKHTNPYGSPYDAYINFMNIIADFSGLISKKRSFVNEGI